MKRTKFHPSTVILFSAIIVLFTFAGRSISSGNGVTEDILKAEIQIKQAFGTGDTALFLKSYTDDACILAPNIPLLSGHAIVQFFKGAYKSGVRDAKFTNLGLFGQTSEYVTQHGAFEIFDADEHSLGTGKVLLIWKKTDGGWKIFRDAINFDAPASPRGPSAN